ncbi:MAG TPA: PQQ-binding-like beta-propeller repeat protein [Opitutaceae bacterium]|nr:PQQ-binding-like beta-propeller repeat protein [Opitutaceae bacterium]
MYSLLESDIDVKGRAYEEIVGSNLRGDRGEFFTPRNICQMAVEMLDPGEKQLILDPACGTGGFLITAMNHVIRKIQAAELDRWKGNQDRAGKTSRERIKKFAEGGLETNPLVIGGVVYGTTPTRKVIALDAVSGRLLWKFDSGIPGEGPVRSVAYWTDGRERRIFSGVNNFLYALDAADGKPVADFGEGGRIDLRKGLGGDYRRQIVTLTSPGVVYRDLIIVGGREPEDHPSPPGDIRAFDVRTGALRWTFHTIPHPGEFGYETWPKDAWQNAGAANNWTGMALDAGRGIVYVPTGSAVPDWYGADRVGDNLFADTLLALDAATGKRLWHFQAVHHDIWDFDFPAPPVLLTVTSEGKRVDAVAQTTKTGYVFLFDRVTGRPLFPIKETPVPASTVPGEVTSPTQPLPTLPAPLIREGVTEDMLTTRTPEAHAWVLEKFRSYAGGSGGQFVPARTDKMMVAMPGANGGGEWGGPAVDPATGILYVNANETPRLTGLILPPRATSEGERIYQQRCIACHGLLGTGVPPEIPSLVGANPPLTDQRIVDVVHQGKGRMPPVADLTDDQLKTLIRYVRTLSTPAAARRASSAGDASKEEAAPAGRPHYTASKGWFNDPDGYPSITPPWGTLNAIDMNTGKYVWKIPLGYYPELAAKGLANTGTLNYGGPLVTRGGLVFIAATAFDRKFRAFNSRTGELLWETELPFPGMATPATYMVDGKQYVLIASGGEGNGSQFRGAPGGIYIAYVLP